MNKYQKTMDFTNSLNGLNTVNRDIKCNNYCSDYYAQYMLKCKPNKIDKCKKLDKKRKIINIITDHW